MALSRERQQHELRRARGNEVAESFGELQTASKIGVDEAVSELTVVEQKLTGDEFETVTNGGRNAGEADVLAHGSPRGLKDGRQAITDRMPARLSTKNATAGAMALYSWMAESKRVSKMLGRRRRHRVCSHKLANQNKARIRVLGRTDRVTGSHIPRIACTDCASNVL